MSGGHFNYKQSYLSEIADEIESIIREEESPRPKLVKDVHINIYEKSGGYLVYHFLSKSTYDEAIKHFKDAGYYINEINSEPNHRKAEAVKDVTYQINEWISEEYKDENGEIVYFRDYSKETLDEFKKAVKLLREAKVYAQRIDWLLSDDDGEETFHKRLKEELDKLNIYE